MRSPVSSPRTHLESRLSACESRPEWSGSRDSPLCGVQRRVAQAQDASLETRADRGRRRRGCRGCCARSHEMPFDVVLEIDAAVASSGSPQSIRYTTSPPQQPATSERSAAVENVGAVDERKQMSRAGRGARRRLGERQILIQSRLAAAPHGALRRAATVTPCASRSRASVLAIRSVSSGKSASASWRTASSARLPPAGATLVAAGRARAASRALPWRAAHR